MKPLWPLFLMPGGFGLGWGLGDVLAGHATGSTWIIAALASWLAVALLLSERGEG